MHCAIEVTMFRLAQETNVRLDKLSRRVKEAKGLYEARDFVSYLQWSGLLSLLEQCEPNENLPFNGRLIRTKAEDLLALVNEQFKQPQVESSVEFSQMEQIIHRLDLIAAHVGKFG